MRSILLHVEDLESLETRMQAALSLGRATNGHVTCLHATPIEAYVAFDAFGVTTDGPGNAGHPSDNANGLWRTRRA